MFLGEGVIRKWAEADVLCWEPLRPFICDGQTGGAAHPPASSQAQALGGMCGNGWDAKRTF